MFKFGICTLHQLQTARPHSVFGGKKKISVSLLRDVDKKPIGARVYEAIMFEQVDDRGTYKRTSDSRFAEFDVLAADEIEKLAKRTNRSVRIHDAAVSTGQTSVDFFDVLRRRDLNVQYLATDYCPYLTLLSDNRLLVTVTPSGSIVDITFAPFVFTPSKLESYIFYPGNHVVRKFLLGGRIRKLLRHYRTGTLDPESVTKINLFCPQARELETRNKAFRLDQFDLLSNTVTPNQYDIFRAMNVLNPTYFSKNEIKQLLLNVHKAQVETTGKPYRLAADNTAGGQIEVCQAIRLAALRIAVADRSI